MAGIESLVGKPEEYIKEQSTKLLSQYNIDYSDGYVFCGNSNEAYCEIADIFFDMREEMETTLRSALDSGDMKNYAVNVHALKSNAKSLGATELADIAYEHELKSKADDAVYCAENWEALMDAWDFTMAALALYLETMDIHKIL